MTLCLDDVDRLLDILPRENVILQLALEGSSLSIGRPLQELIKGVSD